MRRWRKPGRRIISAKRAVRRRAGCLNILGSKASASVEDLALFQLATTVQGYEELGHDKIQELIAAMQAIEERRIEDENRRARERARTRQPFTDEQRRLIPPTDGRSAEPGRNFGDSKCWKQERKSGH
jgi:hypothetical protein